MTIRNRVPLAFVGIAAISVAVFAALVTTGMTWYVALLVLAGALVIGGIVASVPRTPLVLGNDIDSLSDVDRDALLLSAYQARLDAGGVVIENKEEV